MYIRSWFLRGTNPIKYATISPRGERIEFYGVSKAQRGLYFLLCILLWEHCAVAFSRFQEKIGPGLLRIFEACSDNSLRLLFINVLTSVLFVVSFACLTVHCLVFLLQGRSINRALQVRMVKSKNMVKDRRKISRRSRPDLKPQDPL